MKKAYLICNAHIDPVWQWDYEEGIASAISTFQSAVNLMEKHDYIFNHNESLLYESIDEYAPDLFQSIKEKQKEGKWHILGGWYLQPDCMLPSGETIARELEVGKKYFLENFHYFPTTAVNFDPFGHSRGIVQILTKCGQDSYLFMRPFAYDFTLPAETFLWEGYDGSKVKAHRINAYSSNLGEATKKIEADVASHEKEADVLICWGVGNHGGGPSDKDLTDIENLRKKVDYEIVHTTPEDYFAAQNPTVTFSRSLAHSMAGCRSTMPRLKQAYRNLERELYFAEKIASVASLSKRMEYPEEELKAATKDLLGASFHDALPGTVVKRAEDTVLKEIGHGRWIASQVTTKALFALMNGERVAENGTYPIFVFNPKPYEVKEKIECELSILRDDSKSPFASALAIQDENGNLLPSQIVKEESNVGLNWRKKVVFVATLKPLSLNRFTAREIPNVWKELPFNEDIHFKNEDKEVFISAKTGLIESYKIHGKEMAYGSLFEPFAYQDVSDPWGMESPIVGKDKEAFTLMKEPTGVFQGLHSLEVVEDGDVYLEAEAFFQHKNTYLKLTYRLNKQGEGMEVNATLFPGDVDTCYKLALPLKKGKVYGEEIFGKEELREEEEEHTSHNFIAVQEDKDAYLEILTPDTFGSSKKDGTISLTLMRTPAYCAHPIAKDRPLLRKGIYIDRVDMMETNFRFALKESDEKELKRNADIFAEVAFAVSAFPWRSQEKRKIFSLSLSDDSISLVAFKKQEGKENYLLRLQNCSSLKIETKLKAEEKEIQLTFSPYEVKTILLKKEGLVEIQEMDI